MSNLILYKAHELALSRYSLTEQETKLITYCVSRINPTLEGSKEERTIYVPYDEYARIMGMDKHLAKKNLNNSVKELIKRVVEIQHQDGTYSKEMFHWVNVARFNKTTQSVELTFSEEIQPYLFQLKSFIKYRLDHVKLFTNRYSIRAYEWLLSEIKSHKERVVRISLEDFKYMLMMENKYPQFKKFNHEVLKKILNDINTYSDLKVEIKTQGRPVSVLIWEVYQENPKYTTSPFDGNTPVFDVDFSVTDDGTPSLSALVEQVRSGKVQAPVKNKYEKTYRLLKVVLQQHNEHGIAMSEVEYKFVLSMLKHFEEHQTYENITLKQNDFLNGILGKYRPKL